MNKETGGCGMSKKSELNFRFHDPNTPEVTAEHLLAILIKANAKKVEDAIREQTGQHSNQTDEGRLAV